MFGCLVTGQLPQTNLYQVDATHCAFDLTQTFTITPGNVNHLCVFMTGERPFEDGMGASVHFHWPGKGFQLLGILSNDKPSAIFRLRAPQSSAYADSTSASFASHAQGQEDQKAFLGLALEPLHALLSLPTPASTASSISNAINPGGAASNNSVAIATSLAPLVAQNLFSYLSSFSSSLPVPEEIIKKWYENFISRVLRSGIGFLERGGNE